MMNLINKKFKQKPDSKWVEIKINNWMPKEGERIEGRLVQIRENNSQIIYVLETGENERVKIWGKTYLNELMDEIDVGDYIRITYNGIAKTKNNRQMKKYKLERRMEDAD